MTRHTLMKVGFFISMGLASTQTLALSNCPNIYEPAGGREPGIPVVEEEPLIKSNLPILGGKVTCNLFADRYTNTTKYELSRQEEGVYKGVKYRFYTDGSGSIQGLPTNKNDLLSDPRGSNWSLSCNYDGMDDTAWCSAMKHDLTLLVISDGSTIVSVGNENYPESGIAIRVDKGEVYRGSEKTGFSKEDSAKIIEEMVSGESVLTRYKEWPYDVNIDRDTSLFGFEVALELIQNFHNSIMSKK